MAGADCVEGQGTRDSPSLPKSTPARTPHGGGTGQISQENRNITHQYNATLSSHSHARCYQA